MRPVNDAAASTLGQTGRKEAAEKDKRGHPAPRQREAALCNPAYNRSVDTKGDTQPMGFAAPWNPYMIATFDFVCTTIQYLLQY